VGWTQFAYMRWPKLQVQLSLHASATASALVVFSPADSDFVCVEPVSHINDGINAHARGVQGTGIQMLAPGRCLEMETTIRVEIGESSQLIL
jgi:aldose 1-epimerase